MSDIIEKIKKTPDIEDEKTLRLFQKFGDIKKQGFLNKDQAIEILKWKSPRPLKFYKLNTDNDFRAITKLAFASNVEKLRIHALTALHGVNYPAASAILMFYDRTRYPVIDIRVWRQLHQAKLVKSNARGQGFSLNEWEKYLEVIRQLAGDLKLTARQVEKRLFDIDVMGQTGNLYKSVRSKSETKSE